MSTYIYKLGGLVQRPCQLGNFIFFFLSIYYDALWLLFVIPPFDKNWWPGVFCRFYTKNFFLITNNWAFFDMGITKTKGRGLLVQSRSQNMLPVIICGEGRAGPSTFSNWLGPGLELSSWIGGGLLAWFQLVGFPHLHPGFAMESLVFLHPTDWQSRAPGLMAFQLKPTGFQSEAPC